MKLSHWLLVCLLAGIGVLFPAVAIILVLCGVVVFAIVRVARRG